MLCSASFISVLTLAVSAFTRSRAIASNSIALFTHIHSDSSMRETTSFMNIASSSSSISISIPISSSFFSICSICGLISRPTFLSSLSAIKYSLHLSFNREQSTISCRSVISWSILSTHSTSAKTTLLSCALFILNCPVILHPSSDKPSFTFSRSVLKSFVLI